MEFRCHYAPDTHVCPVSPASPLIQGTHPDNMTTLRLFGTQPQEDTHSLQGLDKFAEKYRVFFPRVFAYVYGRVHNVHLTEDLVADVFERAFLKVDSLRNDEAFSTWLFTIARNVIISHGRKRYRETTIDPDVL